MTGSSGFLRPPQLPSSRLKAPVARSGVCSASGDVGATDFRCGAVPDDQAAPQRAESCGDVVEARRTIKVEKAADLGLANAERTGKGVNRDAFAAHCGVES